MAEEVYPVPSTRRLRVYAFDPQASTRVETAAFNVATIALPWEQAALGETLEPGPVNAYLEVIDIDPVSGEFYDPIDLNHPLILAQDGLAPSEGDPRFHQQMVFAVAMKTIRAFERALGRTVLWSPRKVAKDGKTDFEPVPRLRVYPHALREANAYYSPEKKALLFGYFKSTAQDAGANWVFTALSHDVIAHETTHAILDGLHRRFVEPSSVDSLAFHEAFSDIVALLSHFTLYEAVYSAIASNGGNLDERSVLSGLARQFGLATGRKGALREAIDTSIGSEPDPSSLDRLIEPHERGAVLVSAVFDAFLTIYHRRTADLLRIGGVRRQTGVSYDLHPDLAARLTREAVKTADHVLRICIRALDYLPPVDVRFGEFLRAVVTADFDLVPDDPFGYRLAMIEAFRRRGILPDSCLSLAVDSLLWEQAPGKLVIDDIPGLNLEPAFKRQFATKRADANRLAVWRWLNQSDVNDREWQDAVGVILSTVLYEENRKAAPPQTVSRRPQIDRGAPRVNPPVEVHQVRATRRAGPDGQDIRQLVIEVTQRRRGFIDPAVQAEQDAGKGDVLEGDFVFRGGATLIVDLRDRRVRYVIRKRIDDEERLNEQRSFLTGEFREAGLAATYAAGLEKRKEPFAMVHRGL
ncbi:gluzincin family metallopeptidase [Xanthobacter versatilis]|uniref:hypothetical protein n=1 Tax=Xanthobacter autotrophicus (strain ATCC BAA-1158 / Py2) TaxID=78245 RepID=UPI0037268878